MKRAGRNFLLAVAGLAVAGLIGWAMLDHGDDGLQIDALRLATAQARVVPPEPTLPRPDVMTNAGGSSAALEGDLTAQAGRSPATVIGSQSAMEALRTLKRCYAADNCGFPQVSNLDGHFAAVKAIAERLNALPSNGDALQLGALAREFLSFPDGHVQAAALALAARLPPDASTVNTAVSALSDSYDEKLFRLALPVLQQWQQVGMSSGYDDMLAATLYTGGVHAAQVVAENLLPFLNEANVDRFELVLQQLQPGARQDALRRSLRDYRLLRGGG